MNSTVCLINVNPNYSCHPEVYRGLLFPTDIFGVFICTTPSSGHAAEGKKEGEMSSPSFLGRAEEILMENVHALDKPW